jgi:hypothetical protein
MSYVHDLLDDAMIGPLTTRVGIAVVSVLLSVAALVSTSPVIRASTPSADPDQSSSSLASDPGMCLEAESSVLDAEAWGEILRAVAVAVEGEPDFFPDGAIISLPDLSRPWEPQGVDTVKIGIWGTGGNDPGSTDERRERLAGTDCLRDGSEWTTTISHALVLAAAERILAGARLPQDDGELLISEDIEADIDVEFYPTEQRVRTILDWSKEAFLLRVGGLCWIDDVLAADAGEVVVSSQAGKDVTPVVGEAGCALFQEFLDETGAGERAIDLLPTEISLADGTVVRFVVESVEVLDTEIVMAGSLETR